MNKEEQKQILQNLKSTVRGALDSINIYQHELQRERKDIHNYILAVQFQLYFQAKEEEESAAEQQIVEKDLKSNQPEDQRYYNTSLCSYVQLSETIADYNDRHAFDTSLAELTWWTNRAIAGIKIYKGVCQRIVRIDNQIEIDYYRPGKIFKNLNIMRAFKTNSKQVNKSESQMENQISHVIFHIYSISGRETSHFFLNESELEKKNVNTVLFQTNCYFLVCKREQTGNALNIYLRQLDLCLDHSNISYWLDDLLLQQKLNNHKTLISHGTVHTDNHVILKANSLFTKTFFQSPFFKIALRNCQTFKFVQNMQRANEMKIQDQALPPSEPANAGKVVYETL